MNKGKGEAGPDVDREETFTRFLRNHGYEQVVAWIECQNPQKNSEATNEKINGEEEEENEATRRKREQRVRDKALGWLQCNVKAPDDEEARTLLSEIALRMKDDPVFRAAIRITLKDPEIVLFGARLHSLKGIWGRIIRHIARP
jgi:hypothetical protein